MNRTTSKADQEKTLVLFQLFASEPQLKLHVSVNGQVRTFTRDEIIAHVKAMDEIGQDYVNTQMEFLRALKTGKIHALIAEGQSNL